MKDGKYQIGFIGAGDIAFLHGRSILENDQAKLKGLWNISESLSQEKAELFSCKIYESDEALLDDSEIDAVFILTNLETHYHYTMKALHAGKHVYVEKPVGINTTEIQDMQNLALKKGLICMPGHNYIYEPGLIRTKKLISKDLFGKIASVYIMYNIHHPEEIAKKYPGVIRQIMTHHAYINLYLTDLPKKVTAIKSVIHYNDFKEEDLAMATIQTESGTLVHYTASFAADDNSSDPWSFSVKVIGTEGSSNYSYRNWVENKPGIAHSRTFTAYQETISQAGQYFINNCLNKKQPPLSTMADAIMAQRIVEAIEEAIESNKHINL